MASTSRRIASWRTCPRVQTSGCGWRSVIHRKATAVTQPTEGETKGPRIAPLACVCPSSISALLTNSPCEDTA